MKKQNFLTKVISIFLSFNLLLSNLLYPFTILAREADEDDYYSQPQAAETSSPPQQQEIPYEEVYYPPPAAEPPTYPTPQYQQEIPYEEIHPAPPPPVPEPQAEAPQPTTPPWVEPERQQEVAYEEQHPSPAPQTFGEVILLIDDPLTQQAAITNYNYQGSSYERDYDNAYSEVRADLTPSPGPAQTVADAPAAVVGFAEDLLNPAVGAVQSAAQDIAERHQKAEEDRLDKKLAEANASFDQATAARSKEIDEYINAPPEQKLEAIAQVWNIPSQTPPDQVFTKLRDEHKAFGIDLQGTFANFTISIGLQTDLVNRANLGFTPAGIGLNIANFFVNHPDVLANLATSGYASIKNEIDEINRDAASLEPARNAVAGSFLAHPAAGYDHTGDAAVLTYETEIKAEIANGTYHSVEEALAANPIRANVLKYWGATPADIQNFVNASGDTREKLDEYYRQQVDLAGRDADAAYNLAATTALNLAAGPIREAVGNLAVAGARAAAPKVKALAGRMVAVRRGVNTPTIKLNPEVGNGATNGLGEVIDEGATNALGRNPATGGTRKLNVGVDNGVTQVGSGVRSSSVQAEVTGDIQTEGVRTTIIYGNPNNVKNVERELSTEYVGKGVYGKTFVDKDTGTLTKTFSKGLTAEDVHQIEFMQQFGGKAGIPKFKGLVTNPEGKIVGFDQQYVPNTQTLGSFLYQGGKLTDAEIQQAVANLRVAQQLTGKAHGDLAFPEGVHGGNVLIQKVVGPDGKVSREIKIIDWGGHNLPVLDDPEFVSDELRWFATGLRRYEK